VTPRRRWVLAIALLVLAQGAAVFLWQRLDQRRRVAGLVVAAEPRSEPGHDLLVERLDGSVHDVRARSDRFQLFHFWATWCPPCRSELPTLLARASRDRARLRVWIISTDPDWASIRRFFRGTISPAVVRDPGRGHQAYGVTALPDSYLLDPTGRIVARFAGGQLWSSREMDKVLDRLMLGSSQGRSQSEDPTAVLGGRSRLSSLTAD
jgi:cytochrome c biogenesis protein CcmG, thiol:disulfide interchange protein DsbE